MQGNTDYIVNFTVLKRIPPAHKSNRTVHADPKQTQLDTFISNNITAFYNWGWRGAGLVCIMFCGLHRTTLKRGAASCRIHLDVRLFWEEMVVAKYTVIHLYFAEQLM